MNRRMRTRTYGGVGAGADLMGQSPATRLGSLDPFLEVLNPDCISHRVQVDTIPVMEGCRKVAGFVNEIWTGVHKHKNAP